jgi:hypothetical protein
MATNILKSIVHGGQKKIQINVRSTSVFMSDGCKSVPVELYFLEKNYDNIFGAPKTRLISLSHKLMRDGFAVTKMESYDEEEVEQEEEEEEEEDDSTIPEDSEDSLNVFRRHRVESWLPPVMPTLPHKDSGEYLQVRVTYMDDTGQIYAHLHAARRTLRAMKTYYR